MKIIASLVLYKHQYQNIKLTLNSLFNEASISKVVVVDNGNYCHWLATFCHEKLSVITLATNKGFGAGHNEVFKYFSTQADFILICNPDIVFKQGEVDKLYQYCHSENVGLATPKIVYPDGNLQHSCKLLPSPPQLFIRRFLSCFSSLVNADYELHKADYTKPFFAPSLSGCFLLISQQALLDVQGFDTRFFLYLEDVDLSRRVSMSQHNVRYYPDAQVTHESQRRSYYDIRFLFYHLVSAIRYFNKWGWFRDEQRTKINQRCIAELPYSPLITKKTER